MGEKPQIQHPFSLPPPPLPRLPLPSSSRVGPAPSTSSSRDDPPAPPPLPFDPSRMIGIIRRKALIKDLAAVYHGECLACCQDLLERQKKIVEPFLNIKAPEESRKETTRPSKRIKKTR